MTVKLGVVDDYDGLSRVGADLVTDVIVRKPAATVVAATGETPVGLYRDLAGRSGRQEIDGSRLCVFQLDEYLGVGPEDRRSLYGWMKRELLDPLRIPDEHVVRLRGEADDPESACRQYDRTLEDVGGFDLAILGLGPNGHLGFNEPPCGPDELTRTVDLTPESIESNARYWGELDLVPRQAVTVGMAELLNARSILLLVSGGHKHEILRRTVWGPITPEVPASYLRHARNVTIVADRDAVYGARQFHSPY